MNAKYGLLLAASVFSASAPAQTVPQADPVEQPPAISPEQPSTQPSQAPIDSSGASSMQSDQSSSGMQSSIPPAPPAGPAEPVPKVAGGISYMCGGVGEDEANSMKQAARDYGLMLTFAARNGSYLADVNVDITDSRGKSVLKTMCDAPIMLVDLPKGGTYRVRAEANGHALTTTARVPGKGNAKAVALVWPSQLVGADDRSDTSETSGTSGTSDDTGNDAR